MARTTHSPILPTALAWGAGLGLCLLGLATSAAPGSAHGLDLASDALSVAGFFCLAEAYLLHFGQPLQRGERLILAATCLALAGYAGLHLGNPRIERLLGDVAASCMLGLALARVAHAAASRVDRALVLAGSLIVIAPLIRVLADLYFSGPDGPVTGDTLSAYALTMKATTVIVGAVFALSIAVALADRVVREIRSADERDPLTGLLNRRGFERAVTMAAGRGQLQGAVIVADIDHFRLLANRYGAEAADAMIREFAAEITTAFGTSSIRARFGGAGFASFIPDAALADAGVAAQAIRLRFAARDWRALGLQGPVTASFGVVRVAGTEMGSKRMLARAGACLEAARDAGRNQVVLEGGMFEIIKAPAPDIPSNVIPLRRKPADPKRVASLQVSG